MARPPLLPGRIAVCIAAFSAIGVCGCDELLERRSAQQRAGDAAEDQPVESDRGAGDSDREPEQAAARSDNSAGAWPKRHVIDHGDTLYSIALRHYGDGSKWPLIAEANSDVPATGLLVGHTLIIPRPQ